MTVSARASFALSRAQDKSSSTSLPVSAKSAAAAAADAGVDYKASEKDIVRVDVRYIDIETEAELDGQKLDDVAINPLVFGMSYVRMF